MHALRIFNRAPPSALALLHAGPPPRVTRRAVFALALEHLERVEALPRPAEMEARAHARPPPHTPRLGLCQWPVHKG